MKNQVFCLLWILLFASLISTALADPQIGGPPFYKYPFVFDYEFDVPDNSSLALGPGQPSPPPRGTIYPDGKWYSGYWGHLSPDSYGRVESGMARLKTVSIHWNPTVYGGTMVNQGRASHQAVQLGHFQGSNTTSLDANPTARIIFNYGETIPSGTLWLDVKAKILDRAVMNYENFAAAANLALNFQFQPEYRTGSGIVVLEDYDNPDFWAGGRIFPKVVNFDISLSSHSWNLGIDRGEQAVGYEFRHINSASDADLHIQRVEGQMLNTNTWYTFHIDLGYNINRALQMTEDHYYGIEGYGIPYGWYALNRLILRNIQLYTEASGALIQAEVDRAFIYTTKSADVNGDGKVDIRDLASVAKWYGNVVPPAPPKVDISIDSRIDIKDLALVAREFGKVYSGSEGSSSSSAMTEVLAGETATIISVNPGQITAIRHQTFSVNVTIVDVTSLYGWEFMLYWNSTVLNLTSDQTHAPNVWGTSVFEAGAGIQNNFNSTHGRYWKAMSALNPAPSFNGSTVIATLTFDAKTTGATVLSLQDTELCDNNASAISHTSTSGSVTVLPQTRYLRGDTQTVNGLTTYKLETTQGGTQQSNSWTELEYGLGACWGIRVWKRSASGSETEITSGSVVAQVSRTEQGAGLQFSTWSSPKTNLSSADSIVIRVYQKIGSYPWQLAATFTTLQLNASQLDAATWSVYYYTNLSWTYIRRYGVEYTTAYFYWSTSTYNSRTQDFEYT